MIRRSISPASLGVVGLVLIVVGTAWAGYSAYASPSPNAECYVVNICDSLTFRVVSELLEGGQNPYSEADRLAHVSETRLDGRVPPFDLPFQYPPNGLPLFATRGWGSPRLSHVAFILLTTLVFLVLSWFLVRRALRDPVAAGLLLGGVSFSGAASFNAQLGQTGALAAALVIGAVLLWRQVPFAAGALVGVLAFKPQYAIPLALVALVRQERQVILGGLVSAAALCVASGVAYGFTQWRHFIAVAGEPNDTAGYMVNWMGLAWRVAPEHPFVEYGALPVFIASVVVLGVTLWTLRNRTTLAAQLAVAVAVAVVISPNTHPYDLLVLMPALAYVSARGGGLAVGPLFFLLTWVLLPPPPRWLLALTLVCFAGLTGWLLAREARPEMCQNGQTPDDSVGAL